MNYKHIVFDIDGTLLNTESCILSALQDTLSQRLGRNYSAEELTFALGIPGLTTLGQLGIPDAEEALTLWQENMKKYAQRIRPYPGIGELVEKLHATGCGLGIVTSKNRKEFEEDAHLIPTREYFFTVICADDTEKHKPDPQPLLKYMELTGTGAREILYIGDSKYDGLCARDAGVDFALALWGTHDAFIPAKYYPEQPMDLLKNL